MLCQVGYQLVDIRCYGMIGCSYEQFWKRQSRGILRKCLFTMQVEFSNGWIGCIKGKEVKDQPTCGGKK